MPVITGILFLWLPKFPFLSIGTLYDSRACTSLSIVKPKNTNQMSVKVKPLADRVIVEPAPAEERTASGIIIPDTAKEKPQRGTVVAAGGGKKDEPMTVKEGDVIMYGQYAGTEIKIDGKNFLIMRESDIFGILEN
jgi:chaperonin GroES